MYIAVSILIFIVCALLILIVLVKTQKAVVYLLPLLLQTKSWV